MQFQVTYQKESGCYSCDFDYCNEQTRDFYTEKITVEASSKEEAEAIVMTKAHIPEFKRKIRVIDVQEL